MKLPDFPAALARYMHWDLSPVRPWEWGQIIAADWTEAQAVQDAYRAGIEDARAEKRTSDE